MTPVATVLLLGAILLEVLGQTLFKLGLTRRVAPVRSSLRREAWHPGYLNRWIGLGVAAYAVELVLWLAVLSTSRLNQAFPLLALSYCGVAIASRLVFQEMLRPSMLAGIGLITAGAAMVISSS